MMARSQIPFVGADAVGAVTEGCVVTITKRDGGAAATIYAAETGASSYSTSGIVRVAANGRIPGWLDEGSYNLAFGAPLSYTRALDIARGDGVGNLAAGIVTTAKIADGAVTTEKVADGAITAAEIAASSVTEPKFADSAATARTVNAGAVTNAKIASDTITNTHLGFDQITAAKMAPNSVGKAEILDWAVTGDKIADNAITTAKIVDGTVTNATIADDAFTTAKIEDFAVQHDNLMDVAIPVGTIWPTALTIAELPAGTDASNWKLCDGGTYWANDYPALWAIMGGYYGAWIYAPTGAWYFAVPDLRGRMPVGLNTSAASQYGAAGLGTSEGHSEAQRQPKHGHTVDNVSFSSTQDPAHNYTIAISGGKGSLNNSGAGSHQFQLDPSTDSHYWGSVGGGSHTHTYSGIAGALDGPIDLSAYLVCNFMIKVK